MLKFIGTGSAFNTAKGNNSAYFIENGDFFLIDCGSCNFKKIKENSKHLFDGINKIYVIITHTHPDHVGSLGDLIFYIYYYFNKKISIIYPDKTNLINLLHLMGIGKDKYNIMAPSANKYLIKNISIEYINAVHTPSIKSYSYCFDLTNDSFYYSGDSSILQTNIIDKLNQHKISYIYQDTCFQDFPNNPHMNIYKLSSLIEKELRNKVWLMHQDEEFNAIDAEKLGFKVAINEF